MLPFLTIRDSRAPVVAADDGICQAGGLLVAMMADICVASDRATFRAPELIRGIVDATYAAVLPAHVGIAVARDLLLSARRFNAEEALAWGVISLVVPHDQLREAAIQAVGEILQSGPLARTHVKRMLNDRYGLIDYQTMFASLMESEEPHEGMLGSWRSGHRTGSPSSSRGAAVACEYPPEPMRQSGRVTRVAVGEV